MASELKTSGSTTLESQDGMAKLARTIRDKIQIDEPVKEEGLIDQLERAAIEIDELLGSSLGPKGMNKIIVNPVGDSFRYERRESYLKRDGCTSPGCNFL